MDINELKRRAGIPVTESKLTEMGDPGLFESDPRSYALGMVEEGLVDPMTMITACLKYMSHDDVRGMLDANELSPRFDDGYEDDYEEPVEPRGGWNPGSLDPSRRI